MSRGENVKIGRFRLLMYFHSHIFSRQLRDHIFKLSFYEKYSNHPVGNTFLV